MRRLKKVGLLGGTFDPVHIGHLLMARTAMEAMSFDKVVFIPSAVPPHKKAPTLFSAQDRLRMVELATAGIAEFEVSDFEIKKGGKSYTVDTVRYFRGLFPSGVKLFFIVGGDAIHHIDSWKDSEEIKKICSFVSVNRPGYERGETKLRYRAVTMSGIDMSSTEIRRRILSRKSIQYLVPDAVLGYIRENHLYKI